MDEHGTSIRRCDINKTKIELVPTSATVRDRLNEAQITRVSVLPKAVASSFRRRMGSID